MSTSSPIPFWKLQGVGNDFVVVDQGRIDDRGWRALAPVMNDRHFGIGSDGLLAVGADVGGQFPVLMLNPDGSFMGMCGNGVRCVVRYLFLTGRLSSAAARVVLRVGEREVICETADCGRNVSVDLGIPTFDPALIPVASNHEVLNGQLEVYGQSFTVSCVSVGNPHCVVFVEQLTAVELERLGPAFEHHPFFPARVNVEFVEQQSPERLSVKVWERGAGVTLACGTGACASFIVARELGRVSDCATISLPGGEVRVSWRGRGTPVSLTGPAKEVFRGEWSSL